MNKFYNKGKQIDYQIVDLGLPSGTLWCDRNVGAKEITDYGDYFSWGEINPKERYDDSTYNRTTRDSTINLLRLEDDAAFANMRGPWKTPTEEQMRELFERTYNRMVLNFNDSHINGRLFVGKNGNELFLPYAGFRNEVGFSSVRTFGDYWLANTSNYRNVASYLSVGSGFMFASISTHVGFTVRAVLGV